MLIIREVITTLMFLQCTITKHGCKSAPHYRPHSVSFLGKETDTATPLRLENFGRIDFSLGRWITRGKKTPKSMTPYVKVPGELVKKNFIHYCGRSDHFYMASRLIVLNKVYFSRYSWVGFVKKLSSIFVSNALLQVLRCLDWSSAWKSLLL